MLQKNLLKYRNFFSLLFVAYKHKKSYASIPFNKINLLLTKKMLNENFIFDYFINDEKMIILYLKYLNNKAMIKNISFKKINNDRLLEHYTFSYKQCMNILFKTHLRKFTHYYFLVKGDIYTLQDMVINKKNGIFLCAIN